MHPATLIDLGLTLLAAALAMFAAAATEDGPTNPGVPCECPSCKPQP